MSSHGSESPPDASGGPENARLAPASAPGRRPPPSAERAFQALIEGLPQRIFVKDRDSVYVTSNELFASEYGLTPEKLAGLTDFDLGPAADADRYRREDRRVFEERRPIRTEQSMAAGEMTRVVQWVKAPILDEQDQPVGLIGVSIEASEYKRAALELQKSEMEFKLIWEHCLDGMRLMDGEGNVLLVNDAFCRMCGKTRDELVGHSFTVIYEESRREEILVHFKDRFAARDIEPMFEQELAMWHGGRIWFELSNSFIEVEDRVPHLLSIFRDITERRLAEEKLRDFNARLERSNRELQDFAYIASHDLQEPLRKVTVFGTRLRAKYAATLGDDGCDYLGRMLKASERMQSLINDLLTFSRLTTKAQPFAQVDLNKVAREILGDLETRIEQVGAEVKVGPLPTIAAEPLQMRQLLQNLVGNALKFHRPGVKPAVKIEASLTRDKSELYGRAGQQVVHLKVSDNGIGFEDKYAERIFTVFQRLHTRETYEGTGMGLAIVRKIAEYHGGKVVAQGILGEGATFIVSLPVKQSNQLKLEI